MQAGIYPGGAGRWVVFKPRFPAMILHWAAPKISQIFPQRVPNASDGAPWIHRISRKKTWMSKELFQVLHELCCCWRWVQGYFSKPQTDVTVTLHLWGLMFLFLKSSPSSHQDKLSQSFRKWEQRRHLAIAKPFHTLAKLWDFYYFS